MAMIYRVIPTDLYDKLMQLLIKNHNNEEEEKLVPAEVTPEPDPPIEQPAAAAAEEPIEQQPEVVNDSLPSNWITYAGAKQSKFAHARKRLSWAKPVNKTKRKRN